MAKSWQWVAGASAAFAACVLLLGCDIRDDEPEEPETPNCLLDPGSLNRDIDASEFADEMVKSFRIKCQVKFFDMCSKYPNLITGTAPAADDASAISIAFMSHGLGPPYAAEQGKMTFYCQSAAEVGPRGRGLFSPEGTLISGKRLDDGGWHEVEMVKSNTSASLIVDGETVTASIVPEISAADFVLRPIETIHIGGQVEGAPGTDFNGDIRHVKIYAGDPERLVFSSACNGTALPETW